MPIPPGTSAYCHLFNIFWHTVPVAALYRRHRQLPPALWQFIDFLKQPEPGEIPSLAGAGEGGAAG